MEAPNPGHSRLVARYNLFKRIARWLLVLFILSGITLTIIIAKDERTSLSAIQEGQLGSNMAILGKTIVLPFVRDNLQEILISTDNGNHFQSTGDRWPVTDTTLYLGISPDSSTIVAIDKKGGMRSKKKDEAHFVKWNLTLPAVGDTVAGFAFHSDGRRIYLYGSFPLQLFSIRMNPGDVTRSYDDSLQILSLVTGPNGNMLAYVREKKGGVERLYYETDSVSFRPYSDGVLDFPRGGTGGPQPVVNTDADPKAADSAGHKHDSAKK